MVEKLEKILDNSAVSIQEDEKKYYDKYVAFASPKDFTIVSYGDEPAKVINEAIEKGFKKPVLFYYDNPETTLCYSAA
ncbi:MAG: hypothetical protein AABW67_00535 [Nanoarchaeota archaeon]